MLVKVCALAGGTGGAKLLVGLQRVLGDDLTAIVNIGDDATIYGVHVSPDVDMCTYWLGGIADYQRGWGIAGDTFELVAGLRDLGAESWFSLGDRDFATCVYRTLRLAEGAALSAVTAEITARLGVAAHILPASDDPVRTTIHATDGRVLEFQEYFVKERCAPDATGVSYEGAASSAPAPGVLDAIGLADVVVVCPSNPVLSVEPILRVPGLRDALRDHTSVIAVTPIIRGVALKGPADKLMRELGMQASASGVAAIYGDFCSVFVVDAGDPDELERVERAGLRAVVLDTVMSGHDASERLAKELLSL